MGEYLGMSSENYQLARKVSDMIYTVFGGQKQAHSKVLSTAENLMPIVADTVQKGTDAYASILSRAIDLYEIEVGVKTYDPFVIAKDKKSNLWLYKRKDDTPHAFFQRYKNYLRDDGFSLSVIDKIETICEKVLAYCADPLSGCEERKKGMVVGDVQSGKTANYLALINMAYDYGYKIVVLLAGMTDSLRLQTQKRTDIGVIGAVSDTIGNEIEYCGVGLPNKEYYVIPFTNRENDFAKFIQKNLNAAINDFKKPVILVVKKNKNILESVMERLGPALQQYGSNSLLIIDDEADNASINTAKPDKNPTAINRCIRGIFNNFPIVSYVGFTATPFANIFINPFDDDPDNRDLFPEDFIVQLNAPDNYFGGRKVFSKEGLARPIRIINEDEQNFLPVKHQKDSEYPGLCESLKEAIHCFLINNVIRTLRGQGTKHRSMLINISVYNMMQDRIKDCVANYVMKLSQIIEQDSLYSKERFIKNEEIKKIYDLFENSDFYKQIREGNAEKSIKPVTWEEIQSGMYDEVTKIQTVVINKKEARFDYEDYDGIGARVIAIGGYVLSRGLTLEGLCVSYYSRNSTTYDTALQMCRWFGYRPGYEDLCRVYLSQINVESFNAVLDAVEDLKEQFAEMDIQDKKPKDFGLMVRESPDTLETTLIVTARNKLRNSEEIVYHLNYGGTYADTSKLSKDPAVNKHNLNAFTQFASKLHFRKINNRFMAQNVSKKDVAEFIKKLKIPYVNKKFDTEGLSEYIEHSDVFDQWDVVVATGESKEIPCFMDIFGPAVTRSFHVKETDSYIRIGGYNNRVLDPNIFDSGLWLSKEAKAQKLKSKPPTIRGDATDLSALDYLELRDKPILVIYPLDLKTKSDANTSEAVKKEIKEAFAGEALLAFAIGFPTKESKKKLNYRVNKIKIKELEENLVVDDDEEEDYD